jgi:putative ABC transport system permease protein
MWKATIRGIFARKVRLALTALAVMLGVAFVSATYVLTDTMRRSFDFVFAETLADVDLVVSAPSADSDVGVLGGGLLGTPKRDRLPDDVIDAVREVDGVAAADGFVGAYAQFVDKDGEAIQNGIAPTIGLSWANLDGSGPFQPIGQRSRAPQRTGEIAMDAGTARKHGFEVGDSVDVLLQGPVEEFEIVGLFGLGGTTEFGGLTFAAFDLPTAQRVLASRDAVDAVVVTAADGVSVPELQEQLQATLGPGYGIEAADVVAYESGATVRQFVGLFNGALLAFAAVGLVVGAFIIVNTFTILVAQRTRELGLLRTMGASGRQVLGSVVMEAGTVGVVASVVGLGVGVVLAGSLLGLVGRFGFDVPDTGTVLLARTIVVAIGVGLLVTVGAAIFPAVRAARTPPMVAIHDTVRTSAAPLGRRVVVGCVLLVVGLVVLFAGLAVDPPGIYERLTVVGAGALGAFLGVMVLLAAFARPLARVFGWPVARSLGAPGVLSRRNALRNPRRTAATASALVVGLSLVCLVAIFAASVKASLRDAVDGGVRADLVLSTKQLVGFSPEVVDIVRDLPAVEAASGVRLRAIFVDGNTEYVVGVDGNAIDQVVDLDVVDGGTDGLATGGIMLHEGEADDYDVGVGDTIIVQLPNGALKEFPVAGVYRQQNFIGGFPVPTFLIDEEEFDVSVGTGQQDSLVFVRARPGQTSEAETQTEAALSEDGQEFPNVRVQTRAEFREQQEDAVDRFVAVLAALLALSEIIAVLGIINTLFLSVYERTRELGLLRAVGMARRQVRTMIRGESVIIAGMGGVVGILVGVFWGWAFQAALERQGITELAIPVWQLAAFLVLSVVAGIVAALLPAWRAGRLDVLEAIATE